MATYSQRPGTLDIEIVQGDDLTTGTLDFSDSLSGYTLAATCNPLGGASVTLTVNTVDLSAGQISLTITDTISAALPVGAHEWRLTRTISGNTRTVLAGMLTILPKRAVSSD